MRLVLPVACSGFAALALMMSCGPPEPPEPFGWCVGSRVRDDTSEPVTEAVSLTYAVLIEPNNGVLVEEQAVYSLDDAMDECVECVDTSRDIYEVRWHQEDDAYVLQTPAPDPRTWRCTVQPGGVNVDCQVTHADGQTELVEMSTKHSGRTHDGQPGTTPREQRPCIVTEIEQF